MHAFLWGLGLFIFLADFVHGTRRAPVRARKARSLEHTRAHEIVTPIRVTEAGDALPQSAHFRRRKRSADNDTEPAHWESEHVHYRLSAFGRDYHLNLTLEAGFIAPLYTVSIVGAMNRTHQEEKEVEEDETVYRHCFYKGHVNGETEHAAVISLCSGLLGTFRSSEGEYFVEPLHSYNGEHYEEEHIKPHIVYRKDAHRRAKEDESLCDTAGDKAAAEKNMVSGSLASDLESLSAGLLSGSLPSTEDKQLSANHSSSDSGPHRRAKRFLSYPRFVEAMVVADYKMVEYHRSNLQHYVLTLMSIVSSIYKDPSIGNLIHIVIVKLVIINNELKGPVISFNAQATLKNFCVWQLDQNNLDDEHHDHYDTAILITRQDICRAKDKCDTLGLAELGTVCDPYRSCSISEDSGLSTAFTIAHELGHVFNMPHDDSNKCKEDGVKIQQHVMAPTLNYNTNPWMWSKCSRKYITEFLDTGYGECLLDEPVSRPYPLLQQLPGRIYSVNQQCELIFGPGTQVCSYMMQCRRLWCMSPEGPQRGCRTQHMPWADGTDCGHGRHCKHGVCTPKEHDLGPVDGEWGVWSPFGSCSRTCGGGIKIATRDCNRPAPRNGGQYCVGRRMKFRSCNSEPCSKQRRDFREEQCAAFDGRHFNINGLPPNVRWVPKYSGILMKDRCKLFCRVAGNTAYYQLKDRVIDGTPCGPDTNDICVQGLCRQAGCDHVLNSKARRDKCGVCGGDNSSCKTVAGTLSTVHYGYNLVVRIPSGATNIDVRQHSYSDKPEDDNYLAVANSRGEYLLNGDFVVSMFKREVKVGRAVLEYSGSDHVVERLNCTDRIEEEIVIQVLSVGNLFNPDVRYSYNIPIEDMTQHFIWDAYGPWQECSRLCQGERKRKILCNRELDHMVVSDQRCHGSPRPEAFTEPCNTDCELRWHVARKSECTATCGLGYRTLEIYCAKYNRNDGKTQRVDEQNCSHLQKPDNKEVCHGDCNPGVWEYSPWSECSKSCGGGTRRRSATCMSPENDESKCNSRDKLVVQPCNEFPCPQWRTGEWSECLVTCGKGYKHRQTWCQFGDERLDERFCSSAKPESVQACQQQECASWQFGSWGPCTTSCGPGYQRRVVKCVVSSSGSVRDDTDCNAATRPTDTQDCEVSPCPVTHPVSPDTKPVPHPGHKTQWRFGSWTQCSATCGKGIRMRYVSCRDTQGGVAEDSWCAHLPKPPATDVCSVLACGQWKVLEWSQCSVSCGQGKAARQILCVNFSDQVVDVSECDADDRPATEQECAMPQCPSRPGDHAPFPPNQDARKKAAPAGRADRLRGARPQSQWRFGPWGACSSTCAGGFQRRAVVCQDENGYPANSCDESVRPAEQRGCESGPCPQWVYGNWGKCSKPCGGGVKTRLVVCQRPSGERFSDQSCEILDKPPDREQCNMQPCSHWRAEPWSSCPASCGKGFRRRNVTCVSRSGQPTAEENCLHLPRPRKEKSCKGGKCLKWRTSIWGECSVTCGSGLTSRAVVCVNHSGDEIHDSHCSAQKRPNQSEPCNTQPCEFVWITGDWEECSVTCGQGYQRRRVSCSEVHSGNENYVYSHHGSSNCPGTPPESYQACRLPSCPSSQVYSWRVGIWGPCSVSCADGWMERMVQCYSEEGELSDECDSSSKPETRRSCSNPDCILPFSCRDVQMQNGVVSDGEQLLSVQGKARNIYCSEMHTESPKEYITLTTGEGENFSEVFAYRLMDPTQCPSNLIHREECQCRRDYTAAGLSTFTRVRLDLSKMTVITTDWKYSYTREGHKVPFATAGDCYSAARCPQGRFRLNLSGTGFQVAENTQWISQGNYAVADIHKSQDGSRVTGMCGGYCGKCTPSSSSGLLIQVS
ncbi:A disintegrin and metalloproteinase with thrombospondin motifs 9 [Ictalurus furcatus]|uniref:A disintegrin and metalloproteinase with thrombospondin motifs 9 n=1 Tax=Ictalurus furcatus TaxID=66913 RepID=UPI002350EE58|nr:A disintegrin and metalloproteinase with thrombospondin motifs 9 [Ictalurus furcatus]